MLKPEEIREDPTFQKFLKKKKGINGSTIKAYVSSIGSFSNYITKSPTEIHDLHKSDLDNRVPEYDMWLADALDDYVDHLVDLNYKKGGISKSIQRIKSFLHAFRLKPTPTVEVSLINEDEDPKHSLDIEDIRKAIQHANPMYKTVFTIQAQTGLAIGDTLSLNVGDFIKSVSKKDEHISVYEAIRRTKNEKDIIGCFDMRRKKNKNKFYTFIGPEALKSIALFLENKKSEELTSDTPLFIKDVARLPPHMRKKEYTKEELRLSTRAAQSYVSRMNKQKNIFPKLDVGNYFRTHKIRAWYSNQLRYKANFSLEDTKYLMGQRTGDVIERYIDPNNYNALKANYRKALPFLAINDKIEMVEDQEAIDKLEQENQALQAQLNQQNDQFAALNDRINGIEGIDMRLLEMDLQISEAKLHGDKDKRRELLEQKKELNMEKIDLMSKNNPKATKLNNQRKINFYQERVNLYNGELEQLKNEKKKGLYETNKKLFEEDSQMFEHYKERCEKENNRFEERKERYESKLNEFQNKLNELVKSIEG